MKLICIKSKSTYMESILTNGKEYEVIGEIIKNTVIITDYSKYMHYTSLISSSLPWIRKGYTQENMHEAIPGYITIDERDRLYGKVIPMKYIIVNGDDGYKSDFLTLSHDELIKIGCDICTNSNKDGKPSFAYSVDMIDDYFDYKSIRRILKLNSIL